MVTICMPNIFVPLSPIRLLYDETNSTSATCSDFDRDYLIRYGVVLCQRYPWRLLVVALSCPAACFTDCSVQQRKNDFYRCFRCLTYRPDELVKLFIADCNNKARTDIYNSVGTAVRIDHITHEMVEKATQRLV